MPKTRIIPVVLLKNGRIVQSKFFRRHQVLGTPTVIFGRLSNWCADEIIFLDISRDSIYDLNRDDLNFSNNHSVVEIISEISKQCFMPLTIGGGIRTVHDVEKRLLAGADKVSINFQAFNNPQFLEESARLFGSQCLVVSIDVKKIKEGVWEVYTNFGKNPTGILATELAAQHEKCGAGEILINSIDCDGQGQGYDLELIDSIVKSVSIPVIALGGAGCWSDFSECIDAAKPSAVAAGNIFQYTENSYYNATKHLFENGYNVRKPTIETIAYAGDR